jgi:hypothetical protein
MSSKLIYYVYAYLRSKDSATAKAGTPYYIGKGKDNRAYGKHHFNIPSDHSKIIFIECNLSEIGALALERRLIRWYGRKDCGTGILSNKTDGGEGASGRIYVCTPETKAKLSASSIGKKRNPLTDKQKETQRQSQLNRKPKTDAEKLLISEKLSKSHAGIKLGPQSPEHIAKLAAIRKGVTLSDEHKQQISKSLTGKTRTAEQCLNISMSRKGKPSPLKGKPISDEHKRNISIARQKRKIK